MSKSQFLVPRLARQIEQDWGELLSSRFGCSVEEFRDSPEKFMTYKPETIRIDLMDGSHVEFKYAFAVVSEEFRAIAVFTEHCGHHIYPYHEAKIYRDGLLQFQQAA